ncbi:hypothetical protein J2Z69_000944 [Paenibacillus shirakamiensis]|uniref:Uncharacterized protein n=1 Tax=Paenibacillus shirakamiensis TaxID=1265935 RepID=A0ABS4JDX8_9BACL|nr:hypothetical protein [Paenibacillus shirakamiensis]MBP1999925.1 hypothetical protein [Paenibacillus shirakamiensis]
MSQRFRITRSMQGEQGGLPSITLEECIQYFASLSDFAYSTKLVVTGAESTMTIEGDFFMWTYEDLEIPFRLYMGDIYVAVTNEAVIPKMMDIATDLRADILEG